MNASSGRRAGLRTSGRSVQSAPPSRSLVLIDLENIVGLPPRSIAQRAAQGAYEQVLAVAGAVVGRDLVVVAVNPHLAFIARTVAPHARLKARHGEDGADRCLLEELDDLPWLAGRFGRVVLASGDGIFAEKIGSAGAAGLETVVVSRQISLSRRLQVAVHDVRAIPGPQSRAA